MRESEKAERMSDQTKAAINEWGDLRERLTRAAENGSDSA